MKTISRTQHSIEIDGVEYSVRLKPEYKGSIVTERVEYIRKHRSQFEFRDFADLLGCVRGNYFSGYASELLY